MDQQEQSRWRPTRRQLLWAGGIAALAFLIIVICGYLFEWKWTGLSQSKVNADVQPAKTLWDWLSLLIVPVVLALGGYLFTRAENRAAQAAAERRTQDEALQAYLDQMGQLLLDKDRPLRQSKEGDVVRTLARARTSTVLGRLSSGYKSVIITFLAEAELVQRVDNRGPIIGLSNVNLYGTDLSEVGEVDLRGANLSRANLSRANLTHAILLSADLTEADLSGAVLRDASLGNAKLYSADLRGANLSEAHMSEAHMTNANLSNANLSGTDLSRADLRLANLKEANLSNAGLSEADLSNANLSEADLRGSAWKWANLSNAQGVTNEELAQQAETLEDTTMPNGQKYEEWLKSKGSGEKSGPS